MLPFFLYFAAGVITGFHVYTLLALTVYGAPFNSLELVSLLGSVGLLIAAFIGLFKPYAAARIAFIACLMTWSFYGPAIANVVRTKFDKHSAVSANPNNRATQPFALVSR
jgi:phosphoglycerol transferase MdoB-like AlkP superfamily enzyme